MNLKTKIEIFILRHLIWFLVIGTFLFFGIVQRGCFTLSFVELVLFFSSYLGILVLGQGICLLSGHFDLSIAQNAGFSVLIVAELLVWFPDVIPLPLAILLVPLIGGGLGAVNGFFIGKVGINSFLVTLSTYLIYKSIPYYISIFPISGSALPEGFLSLSTIKIFSFHLSILLFFAIAIVLYFILRWTTFGYKIYSIGGDPEISKRLGINTGNTTFYVYTLIGILAGIGGLMYAGFAGTITNSLADGEVFWTFAGAIMGGISIKGGRGSIIGVVGGIILISTIKAGVVVLDINPNLRIVILGGMVLVAILINKMRDGLLTRYTRRTASM